MLGKVVAVLFAFSADDYGLSLAELGRRTGLAKGPCTGRSTTSLPHGCSSAPPTATA